MVVTKTGKCVVCRGKVRRKREFLPQTRMFEPLPKGIPKELVAQIKAWRDEPILCDADMLTHEVRKVVHS